MQNSYLIMANVVTIKGLSKSFGRIQALKEVQTGNPVIMLDEIDKVGASYQGDPASALLEVLDPEQNNQFLDHYLDLRVDLSRVLFICTANQLDTIPRPLMDRMEVIRLSGYLTEEKIEIASKYLWPRQLERAGLKKSQINLTEAGLKKLIEDYAREAGVRNLDKQLGRLVRKAVMQISTGKSKKVSISGKNLNVDSRQLMTHAEPIRLSPCTRALRT